MTARAVFANLAVAGGIALSGLGFIALLGAVCRIAEILLRW